MLCAPVPVLFPEFVCIWRDCLMSRAAPPMERSGPEGRAGDEGFESGVGYRYSGRFSARYPDLASLWRLPQQRSSLRCSRDVWTSGLPLPDNTTGYSNSYSDCPYHSPTITFSSFTSPHNHRRTSNTNCSSQTERKEDGLRHLPRRRHPWWLVG